MWKQIKGYDYEINSQGEIKSIKTGKLLKQVNSWNGYLRVNLYRKGVRKGFMVHRLVAENFISNPNSLPEVNHKDFNKANNEVDNLEWCSKQENMDHAKAGGVLVAFRGEQNTTSKLKEKEIEKIRVITGRKLREIAEEFGVSVRTIVRVRQKESWKHI